MRERNSKAGDLMSNLDILDQNLYNAEPYVEQESIVGPTVLSHHVVT